MATDPMADCVFSEDIMFCILTRLPLKPIGRFKSVCKPWLELFSTPEFVKSHRSQFSSNPKNESIILFRSNDNGKNSSVSLFNLEANEKTKPTILDSPLGDAAIEVVGCCNGLVCIFKKNVLGRKEEIVLWNPALKLSKSLSSPSIDSGAREMVSLGFGYDAEADDFKVVRIVCLKKKRGEEIIKGVEVYSVNSDSWTTIEPGFQFKVLYSASNAIVNGKPYWVAHDVEGSESGNNMFGALVWFDVGKLVFRTVPLSFGRVGARLVDWNGSVAALMHSTDYDEDSDGEWYEDQSLDVWVFDEGERTWREKYSFETPNFEVGAFHHFLKNGNLLVSRSDSRLYLVDPETECVKKLFYGALRNGCFWVHGHTESLTSIEGMVKTVGEKNKLAGDGATSSKRKARKIRSRLHGLRL